MPILLFLLNYWKVFAVGGAILAGVLWYNKQLSDSFDTGFKAAEAILSARYVKKVEQERNVIQEQSKELEKTKDKEKETIRVITKEVIKYVENLPAPSNNQGVPTCRNVTLDDDFVRLWNDAASNTTPVKPPVSGEPTSKVSK